MEKYNTKNIDKGSFMKYVRKKIAILDPPPPCTHLYAFHHPLLTSTYPEKVVGFEVFGWFHCSITIFGIFIYGWHCMKYGSFRFLDVRKYNVFVCLIMDILSFRNRCQKSWNNRTKILRKQKMFVSTRK